MLRRRCGGHGGHMAHVELTVNGQLTSTQMIARVEVVLILVEQNVARCVELVAIVQLGLGLIVIEVQVTSCRSVQLRRRLDGLASTGALVLRRLYAQAATACMCRRRTCLCQVFTQLGTPRCL